LEIYNANKIRRNCLKIKIIIKLSKAEYIFNWQKGTKERDEFDLKTVLIGDIIKFIHKECQLAQN